MSMAVVYERVEVVRKVAIEVPATSFDALGRFSKFSGFGVQSIAINFGNFEDCRGGHHFAVPQVPTQCFVRSFEEWWKP